MEHVSICILTCDRTDQLEILLASLTAISCRPLEVIVVDNGSTDDTARLVSSDYPDVIYLKQTENIGTAGRNVAMNAATGEIIVALDDDLIGICDDSIEALIDIFETQPDVGAVCFKVVDPLFKQIMNWSHHREAELYGDKSFVTNEISEGAVAFRKAALDLAGLYPSNFFLGHEGADLAIRIMNHGYKVIYSPRIVVEHYHSLASREPWRRYYYDTRNTIWLVVRNYPIFYGLKHCGIQLGAMLVYSLRDGFFRYWCKGVFDGLRQIPQTWTERQPMSDHTRKIFRGIDRHRPSVWYIIKKRLFRKGVRI